MTHDPEMAQHKVTQLCTSVPVQYGQSLVASILPGTGGTIANIAKDVVRWKGKSESDLQACRVYLGPRQPQPGLVAPTGILGAGFSYEQPTPWQLPQPNQYDAMSLPQIFARVSFGGGGVQHQAYVDWPWRGSLFQVSAQYIQVDAVATFNAGGVIDPTTLPRLLAHICPEPGGGDSVQPATFTYLGKDFNDNTAPNAGVLFQVPPFARAFRPILNQEFAFNAGPLFYRITDIGSGNVWYIDASVTNDFNRDDFPLTGASQDVYIQAQTAIGGVNVLTINVGCMFLLDL